MAGDAKRRVWSDRPYPVDHKHDGVLRCALTSASRQRATAAPSGGKESGYAQASADAGPPSGHNRDTINKRNIPSRSNPSCTHLPSTNIPACPGANTVALHLQHYGRGSSHGPRPQRSQVFRNLLPHRRRGAHNPPDCGWGGSRPCL